MSSFNATPSFETFAEAKIRRLAELTATCNGIITEGFASSATGTSYRYASDVAADHPDQTNIIMGSVLSQTSVGMASGWTYPLSCSSDSGATWALVSHTASQIQGVLADLVTWVKGNREEYNTLALDVAAVTDGDYTSLNAIVWPS